MVNSLNSVKPSNKNTSQKKFLFFIWAVLSCCLYFIICGDKKTVTKFLIYIWSCNWNLFGLSFCWIRVDFQEYFQSVVVFVLVKRKQKRKKIKIEKSSKNWVSNPWPLGYQRHKHNLPYQLLWGTSSVGISFFYLLKTIPSKFQY